MSSSHAFYTSSASQFLPLATSSSLLHPRLRFLAESDDTFFFSSEEERKNDRCRVFHIDGTRLRVATSERRNEESARAPLNVMQTLCISLESKEGDVISPAAVAPLGGVTCHSLSSLFAYTRRTSVPLLAHSLSLCISLYFFVPLTHSSTSCTPAILGVRSTPAYFNIQTICNNFAATITSPSTILPSCSLFFYPRNISLCSYPSARKENGSSENRRPGDDNREIAFEL